jgi:hypothetical protein
MSLDNSTWRKTVVSYVLVAVVSVLITGLVFLHFSGDSHTFAATGAVTNEPASSAVDIQISPSGRILNGNQRNLIIGFYETQIPCAVEPFAICHIIVFVLMGRYIRHVEYHLKGWFIMPGGLAV